MLIYFRYAQVSRDCPGKVIAICIRDASMPVASSSADIPNADIPRRSATDPTFSHHVEAPVPIVMSRTMLPDITRPKSALSFRKSAFNSKSHSGNVTPIDRSRSSLELKVSTTPDSPLVSLSAKSAFGNESKPTASSASSYSLGKTSTRSLLYQTGTKLYEKSKNVVFTRSATVPISAPTWQARIKQAGSHLPPTFLFQSPTELDDVVSLFSD